MSDANIVIPPDFLDYVQERRTLWAEFDQSQNERNSLQELAGLIPTEMHVESMQPLTTEATPVAELRASLQRLIQSVAEIQQLQNAIQSAEDEINAINVRFRNTMVGVVIVIIVLVLMIANQF